MKKWTVILVLLVLLGVAVFINFDRIALLIPTDFSETEMVFESDGSTRYYYDTLSDDGKVAYTKILSEIRTHPESIEIPNPDFRKSFTKPTELSSIRTLTAIL